MVGPFRRGDAARSRTGPCRLARSERVELVGLAASMTKRGGATPVETFRKVVLEC
jgi:hypothetical protein